MSNRTALRMRVLPRFPARISATNGLKIVQDNLDLVVKPDFGALTQVPSVSNPNATFFWGWDQSLDMYSSISFQNLVENIQDVIIGPTTAAMEATTPSTDQFIYFTGPDAAAVTGLTAAGRALLDDANAAAQRATLGLSGAAILNVGTTAGTVAAGDDSRIVNAVQTSRTLTAGTGLTGGGDLTANRSLALNSASIASLALADSALQPTTGQLAYVSVSAAQSAVIPSSVKRVQTQFFAPNFAAPATLVGGARYRRISFADLTGVPTQAYFRSVDRFMPDGTTSSTNGGYWLLDEDEVNWTMLGVVPDGDSGNDDTVPAQAAIDFAVLSSTVRKLVLNGTVTVSKLVVSGGASLVIDADNCVIIANSSAAQTALLEVKTPSTHIIGRLLLHCLYKTNYACGFWHWHETQAQFSKFSSVVVNGALIGHRIGNIAYPNSILSEIVVETPQTYGCPVAMEVAGGETYVTISNPQLSADSLGGSGSWLTLPKCSVRNKGATTIVSGGECLVVGDTASYAFRQEPIDRGSGRVEWGTLAVDTTSVETASPLCIMDNIGLTINNTASGRRGMTSFDTLSGYHSQDISPFIYVSAAYDDFLVPTNLNFWKNGALRTQPNVFCEVGSTCDVQQVGDFGPGFKSGLSGIVGGRVNFSRRDVLRVKRLNGQAFTAASGPQVCLYQVADTSGDKARFQGTYIAGTGLFTVPDGGLEDVSVAVTLRMTDAVPGDLRILLNGGEAIRSRIVNGCGQTYHSFGNLASGTTISVDVDIDTNTTGIAIDDLNIFCVSAKRGQA